MAGSALMLVAIVSVATLSAGDQSVTFSVVELAERQALSTNTARLCFLAFALAFVIKVPVFPVHTWLPDAHTQAPTAGSVVLAAVMLKLGTYGLLRFGLYLFPEASVWAAPTLATLGVVGVIYGAIVATMQKDLKASSCIFFCGPHGFHCPRHICFHHPKFGRRSATDD